jgi:hypothetical protein
LQRTIESGHMLKGFWRDFIAAQRMVVSVSQARCLFFRQ